MPNITTPPSTTTSLEAALASLFRYQYEQQRKNRQDYQKKLTDINHYEIEQTRSLNSQYEKDLKSLTNELKNTLDALKDTHDKDIEKEENQAPAVRRALDSTYLATQQALATTYNISRAALQQTLNQNLRKLQDQVPQERLAAETAYNTETTNLADYISSEEQRLRVAAPAKELPPEEEEKPRVKPTLIIARTPYPKWWKDLQTAEISLDDAGTEIIILPNPNFYLYIATIVLTVSGETNITFHFGVFGNSGAMDFGGDGEPRGIVIAMGNSPTSCGTGSFQITSSGAGIHVGGFISYYRESVKED